MESTCLGIVAAMPQEIAPLLRLAGEHKKQKLNGFNLYSFKMNEVPVVLVESGMGPRHAAAATETLIAHASPALILNYGVAGAVQPGLRVGELVLADRVVLLDGERLDRPRETDRSLYYLLLQELNVARIPFQRGTFVTAAKIMNKKDVAGLVEERFANPVLEMETAAVLATADRAGVPVAALRAVSDGAEEELGFSLEEFCDGELNISLWRVLFTVARKPWIIPQLLRLSKNTKLCGDNFAIALAEVLRVLTKEILVR